MRTLAENWEQWRTSWAGPSSSSVLRGAVTVLLAGALFRLAMGGGGRDLESLTLAQTVVFAAAAMTITLNQPRMQGVLHALGGVIAAIAITSFWTIRLESSIRQLLLWLTYLGILVVLASNLRTFATARRFVDAIVAIGGLVSLYGLYLFWGADDPEGRLYATFYAANTFASFLLLVLPLVLSRLACARTRREVFDFGFVAVLLATSLQLTSSRGAWFALVVLVPFALLMLRPPSWAAAGRRLVVVALLTTGAVTLLTHAPSQVFGRTSTLLDSGNRSVGDRLAYWISALEIFRDHPLVGTGAGTFGYVHQQYQRSILVYAQDAHNLYVQTAAEMGIVGVIALVALIVSIARLWLGTLRRFPTGEEHALVAGIGFSLSGFFVHSGLEMNFSFPANPAMAFALVGILSACAQLHRSTPVPGEPRKAVSVWWRYGLVALMALAIAAVQVQQIAERSFQEGRRLFFEGGLQPAAAKFSSAMRWNPLNPRYPSAKADALTRIRPGDSQALGLVQRSISLDRNNPYYYLQLARLLMAQPDLAGHSARIEALIRRSLELDPYHLPDAFQALADLSSRLGRAAGVELAYHEALARFGGQGIARDEVLRARLWSRVIPLYLQWADYLTIHGRRSEAIAVLESLLGEDPGISFVYLRIADLHLQAGSFVAADRVLGRGLLRAPWDEDLWLRWRTLPARRTPIYEL